jgi:micrococcal nuclease
MPRLLSILFALAVLTTAPLSAQTRSCRVAHVHDGDTLGCADGTRVRLLLIDAPDSGRFGAIARRALATLVPAGTVVTLETDSVPRDDEGRVLAYVTVGEGRFVNEILVREGFAFFKPSRDNHKYAERLREAEKDARAERRGVWAP